MAKSIGAGGKNWRFNVSVESAPWWLKRLGIQHALPSHRTEGEALMRCPNTPERVQDCGQMDDNLQVPVMNRHASTGNAVRLKPVAHADNGPSSSACFIAGPTSSTLVQRLNKRCNNAACSAGLPPLDRSLLLWDERWPPPRRSIMQPVYINNALHFLVISLPTGQSAGLLHLTAVPHLLDFIYVHCHV